MGLACRNAAFWGLVLLGLLLFVTSPLAQEASDATDPNEEKPAAPEEWTENLFSFEPLRIDSSILEHQIEITVHRWGSFTQAQSFKLVIEKQPSFIKKAWWAEGETLTFEPKETEKTVNLRFTLAEAGNASGDLVFHITAEDEEISPQVRRFELPFGFGREEGEGCAFLLKEDTPDKIEPNEIHKWVDPEIQPLYACDERLAVFFTPAADLEADWRWSVQSPEPEPNESAKQQESSHTVMFGFYAPPDGLMHQDLELNPFQNIPGKFIIPLTPSTRPHDWKDGASWYWDGYAGWMPGPFSVETAIEQGPSENSLFGVQGSVAGEYTEVATFEFKRLPELRLAGIRSGPPQNVNLGELPWCYDGTLRMSATGSGRALRLDMEASYRRVHWEVETSPEPNEHKASFKATVELPETLTLGQKVLGEGKVTCEEFSQGPTRGYGSLTIRAYAGFGDLVAVSDRQPDDWMIFDANLPEEMGTVTIPDGPEIPILDGSPFSDSEVLETRIPEWDSWPLHVTSWGLRKSGSPERALGFHLRDSKTQFVLPIRFSFPKRVEGETYEVISYAIYKANN
jgi:hypothetical protein